MQLANQQPNPIKMALNNLRWLYLALLSFIWGTSFILMKKASLGFTPIQIGALRTITCTFFLLIIGRKSLKNIEPKHWKWLAITGIVGSLFPAYFYAYAVTGLGSAIPSILNSLTPFNTLWVSILFFGLKFNPKQLLGIIIGLIGTVSLIYQGMELNPNQNYTYAIFPIISSIGYAFNVNLVKHHLQDLKPLAITVGNFLIICIPSVLVLVFTDFFTTLEINQTTQTAFFYLCLLAFFCTAVPKIIFNKLIHISSTVFASSVTYIIPIVAVTWSFIDGERLSLIQILSALIILLGVWLVNKTKN